MIKLKIQIQLGKKFKQKNGKMQEMKCLIELTNFNQMYKNNLLNNQQYKKKDKLFNQEILEMLKKDQKLFNNHNNHKKIIKINKNQKKKMKMMMVNQIKKFELID